MYIYIYTYAFYSSNDGVCIYIYIFISLKKCICGRAAIVLGPPRARPQDHWLKICALRFFGNAVLRFSMLFGQVQFPRTYVVRPRASGSSGCLPLFLYARKSSSFCCACGSHSPCSYSCNNVSKRVEPSFLPIFWGNKAPKKQSFFGALRDALSESYACGAWPGSKVPLRF